MTFYGLLFLIVLGLIFALTFPIAIIWSINTLFGLGIAYTFWTQWEFEEVKSHWWFIWCCVFCFLLGAGAQHCKLKPYIDDVEFQLEMCKEHNRFLEEWRDTNQKTNDQIREYWRIKCGCYTIDEVMTALTRPGRRYAESKQVGSD
jgi:hypothetical protein